MTVPAIDERRDDCFNIVRCLSCGLRYTSPRPTAASLGVFYDALYYDELSDEHAVTKVTGGPSGEVRPRERRWRQAMVDHLGYPGERSRQPWLTRRTARSLLKSRRHLHVLPWVGQGRLLDFGCGGGQLLRIYRARGWDVAGIDFSEEQMAAAREKHDLDVVAGTWPGDAFADRTFDVITAWHVLEHLPDPVGWVQQAKRQLAPGGMLLICCPDNSSLATKWFGQDWWGLAMPVHFNHFTRHDLRRLMVDAGFEFERFREQQPTSNLLRSASRRANRTKSVWWRWLSRQKLLWSMAGRYAAWRKRSEGVAVIGRKPAAADNDHSAS